MPFSLSADSGGHEGGEGEQGGDGAREEHGAISGGVKILVRGHLHLTQLQVFRG